MKNKLVVFFLFPFFLIAAQDPVPSATAPKLSYNRHTTRIFSEIAQARDGTYVTAPNDTWTGLFEYQGQSKTFIGFDIGLNSSSSKATCDDKTATTFILGQKGIPNVEHRLFMKSSTAEAQSLVLDQIHTFFQKHGCAVVSKPRGGTGGKEIYRITSESQLSTMVEETFKKNGEVCLSPYYEIKNEYRLIVLDDQVDIVFAKDRPQVTGNGIDTFATLLCAQHPNLKIFLSEIDQDQQSKVLMAGQQATATWKHNLCLGAKAKLLENTEDPLRKELAALAIKTAKALGVRFASIDIIELEDGRKMVLEVNNGVMTEYLINQLGEPIFQKVKAVFEKAIAKVFAN